MGAKLVIVAKEGDGALREVLDKLGKAAKGAADEGRAFVNGRRAASDATLQRGDVVEVWDARSTEGSALSVLHDAGGVLVVDKPAGLATTPDHRGSRSLLEDVGAIAAGAHPVSRLDVGVSGAVVFATTKAARARLADASAKGTLEKTYVAIVSGRVTGEGEVNAPIEG